MTQTIKLHTFCCVIMTAFGIPVEPEVFNINARSGEFAENALHRSVRSIYM